MPTIAEILIPLEDMISSQADKKQLHWSDYALQAFSDAKQIDASDTSAGAVLRQELNGQRQPFAFFSKKLTSTERRYSTFALREVVLPGADVTVVCDVTRDHPRPYLPHVFRRPVFEALHSLAHSGIRATRRLVAERYVWPAMNRDVASTGQGFPISTGSFRTRARRYSRTVATEPWLFLPLDNAETVTRAFLANWVARFGVPAAITTDQGRQFTGELWRLLCQQLGMRLQPTSAHHPQANANRWLDSLPLVLLGIRSAVRQDMRHCSAELVYGCSLRLPGAYSAPFRVSPTSTRRSRHRAWYIPKRLKDATHVFVRSEAPSSTLHPVYDGSFPVLSKTPKTVTIAQRSKEITVAIDRIKPAFYSTPFPSTNNLNGTFKSKVDIVR
uniref:Integrase catalytic domain-containing protein n=1 Tax=Trichuris muris TaxID=70415 RepID=A0A5S6R4X2_TRIMR